MKYLVRIILVILLAGTLVSGALYVPVIMNKYNENKFVDRVGYVERKDIVLSSGKQELKINEKIKYLGQMLSNGEAIQLVEIPYEPNINQMETFEKRIKEELENWPCINQVSITGLNVNVQDIIVKDIKVYSVYGREKITYYYIQAFCGELSINIYMDSREYKIYHITLRGKQVAKWIAENSVKGNELWMNITTTNDFTQTIEKYYNLRNIKDYVSVGNSVIYSLDEGIDWGYYIDYNKALNVGIAGFENDFSTNIAQYSISVVGDNNIQE